MAYVIWMTPTSAICRPCCVSPKLVQIRTLPNLIMGKNMTNAEETLQWAARNSGHDNALLQALQQGAQVRAHNDKALRTAATLHNDGAIDVLLKYYTTGELKELWDKEKDCPFGDPPIVGVLRGELDKRQTRAAIRKVLRNQPDIEI